MKLIRLTSDNQNGEFETLFNTDIDINENSKIALQNISFSTAGVEYEIDGNNNNLIFSFSNSTSNIDILLDEKVYNQSNFSDLFKNIQDLLNNSITFQSKKIGTQFKMDIENGKTNLSYNISPYNLNKNFFKNLNNNLTVTTTGGGNTSIRAASGGTNLDDDTRNYYSIKPFHIHVLIYYKILYLPN